jgi:hypothetical protein
MDYQVFKVKRFFQQFISIFNHLVLPFSETSSQVVQNLQNLYNFRLNSILNLYVQFLLYPKRCNFSSTYPQISVIDAKTGYEVKLFSAIQGGAFAGMTLEDFLKTDSFNLGISNIDVTLRNISINSACMKSPTFLSLERGKPG